MEPTLRDGDIVLVRKSDRGALLDAIIGIIVGDSAETPQNTERARVMRYEWAQGIPKLAPTSRLYETPPLAVSGDVVVFKDPSTAFPSQLCVKRVLGAGGQYVRPLDRPHRVIAVPSYSLYVEGDNQTKSVDSRTMGPVSKALLAGIAEYVVWPPTRWQRIRRRTEAEKVNGRARAYWP